MPRDMVGNWLYGVAYRTAMKARAMSIKRRGKERQAAETSRPSGEICEELLEQLDHALNRLPDKYRVPVVLCELEGRSRKEVARLLGVPEGTLSWRLAQARKLLAKRLSRHELTIPLGALAVGLSPTLRASTLKTALTAGAVPAQVLTLTEGVIKAMLLTKLKITVCVAALAIVAGVGATGLTYRATAEEPKRVVYDKVYVSTADSRASADDLEALRLEIESLRKELRATKERVKALEEGRAPVRRPDTSPSEAEARRRLEKQLAPIAEDRRLSDMLKSDKSLAGIEEALKKLRANPENKQDTDAFEQAVRQQVAEALEQALKQLKVQEKPRDAGPKKP
jgi:hypothetical protein